MSAERAPRARRTAVVGGGWAGLAAAVEAAGRGDAVTLFEMAPSLGGRARRLPEPVGGLRVDNGQHILIGAYAETLRLLARVGVAERDALHRAPLQLTDLHGHGLRLPPGAALPAFVRGVLAARGWSLAERAALLAAAAGWALRGFRCDPSLSVAQLSARLPESLRRGLIEPLCVAALNTPAEQASAQVFLRVLRDALFAGPGAADLLLPRVDLGALFPDAAAAWLAARGARLRPGLRVQALRRDADAWRIATARAERGGADPAAAHDGALDPEPYDRVLLASSATEAARLVEPHAPDWSALARGLRHEPIVTVLLRSDGTRLPAPMLALDSGADAPAQFVFDLGRLRDARVEPAADGVLAFVISGAAQCIERGLEATARQVQAQARAQLGALLRGEPALLRVLSEKRATFLCTPGLRRPPAAVAPGLVAAGDYVDGPYPATLEAAVRSGIAAAAA